MYVARNASAQTRKRERGESPDDEKGVPANEYAKRGDEYAARHKERRWVGQKYGTNLAIDDKHGKIIHSERATEMETQ
jgi:hypothetical protein